MRLDPSGSDHLDDQAQGLRQLSKPEPLANVAAPSASRVLSWPRIVLLSEFPGTDVGARFAYHLAAALSEPSKQSAAQIAPRQSLLLDLAPAASRLPYILSDRLPADRYPSLWSELAAGRSVATLDIGGDKPLAVAAENRLVPSVLDQLPRLYEQLVRQLSRAGDRFGWIVVLAVDYIVPLDRACWQAADDIVFLGTPTASGYYRQIAALRSRLSQPERERALWTLDKLRTGWFSRRSTHSQVSCWLEAGVTPKSLPGITWPQEPRDANPKLSSRADNSLASSARRVANQLRSRTTMHPGSIAKSA